MHSLENNANIPTFILKLWKLVEDESSNPLICWNRSGRSFIIKDQARFAKELLPLYFKHNNMASFIRQLNMYGFRKVSNIEHGGLKSDADEVEFFHHCFLVGQEEQLQYIKRKMSNNNKGVTSIIKVDEIHDILNDVESIKGRQDSVDTLLNTMKRENEALWREVAILRQKHLKQQQIVEKLLQFLVSIVRNRVVGGIKRKAQLMIDSSSGNNRKILKKDSVCLTPSPGTSGPIIHDITDLDENDVLIPLINDSASNTLVSTLPVNFNSVDTKPTDQTAETSLLNISEELDPKIQLTSNLNDNSTISLSSLPNNILDLDLSQSQTNDDLNEILNSEKLNAVLSTPKITYEESLASSSNITSKKEEKDDQILNNFSTDLVLSKQNTSNNTPLQRLTSDTFNDHVEGIDAELNWLQDQLYGGGLNIDTSTLLGFFSNDQFLANEIQEPSTSETIPKAIMDGSEGINNKLIKLEDNSDNVLFEGLDLNNITSDSKDLLSEVDFTSDIDPSTFT